MRTSSKAALVLVLASALPARSADAPITLRAASVLDGRGGVIPNARITVVGSRITKIEANAPLGATYDLGNATLLPGLIDAHAHVVWYFNSKGRFHTDGDGDTKTEGMLAAAGNAYTTLMSGITTLQSLGSPEDKELRDAIERGVIVGPRMLTSLEPLTERSGTPDELRALVRTRKAEGADVIKIFASKSIREGGGADHDRRATRGRVLRGEGAGSSRPRPRAQRGGGSRRDEGRLHPDRARRVRDGRRPQAHGRARHVSRSAVRPRLPQLPRQPREVPGHRQLQRRGLRVDGEGDPAGPRRLQARARDSRA